MTKAIYLESLKSVPGRSILHYLPKVSHASPWEDRGGGWRGVKSLIYIHLLFVKKIKK